MAKRIFIVWLVVNLAALLLARVIEVRVTILSRLWASMKSPSRRHKHRSQPA